MDPAQYVVELLRTGQLTRTSEETTDNQSLQATTRWPQLRMVVSLEGVPRELDPRPLGGSQAELPPCKTSPALSSISPSLELNEIAEVVTPVPREIPEPLGAASVDEEPKLVPQRLNPILCRPADTTPDISCLETPPVTAVKGSAQEDSAELQVEGASDSSPDYALERILECIKLAKSTMDDGRKELLSSFSRLEAWVRQNGSTPVSRPWEQRAQDWTWVLQQRPQLLKEAREYRIQMEKKSADDKAATRLEEEARKLQLRAFELRRHVVPGITPARKPRHRCCWQCGCEHVIRARDCPRLHEHHLYERVGNSWQYNGPK